MNKSAIIYTALCTVVRDKYAAKIIITTCNKSNNNNTGDAKMMGVILPKVYNETFTIISWSISGRHTSV